MKPLLDCVAEYLDARRALGFKLTRSGMLLPVFVEHLHKHRCRFITTKLALEWAMQPADGHPAWWSQRLSIVRGFATYLQAEEPRHEVPPADAIPAPVRRAVPVLFVPKEISDLLRAARQLRSPLRASTYETLFGLLAATGMRIGEALRLERSDVVWNEGLLVVRHSKFNKSREIVLHPSMMSALRQYAVVRDRHHPKPRSQRFFISLLGTSLIYNNAHTTFRMLANQAGIRPGRPHDLRHTFAVNTLLRWYKQNADVDALMPRLSTYLGHSAPDSTYWYLTASPALLSIVRRKLERATRSGL